MVRGAVTWGGKAAPSRRARPLPSNLNGVTISSNETTERRYRPGEIERKWQAIWEAEKTWQVSNDPSADADVAVGVGGGRKSYVLEMLPYPSGEPHVGHLKNYSMGDAIAHFHR